MVQRKRTFAIKIARCAIGPPHSQGWRPQQLLAVYHRPSGQDFPTEKVTIIRRKFTTHFTDPQPGILHCDILLWEDHVISIWIENRLNNWPRRRILPPETDIDISRQHENNGATDSEHGSESGQRYEEFDQYAKKSRSRNTSCGERTTKAEGEEMWYSTQTPNTGRQTSESYIFAYLSIYRAEREGDASDIFRSQHLRHKCEAGTRAAKRKGDDAWCVEHISYNNDWLTWQGEYSRTRIETISTLFMFLYWLRLYCDKHYGTSLVFNGRFYGAASLESLHDTHLLFQR